MSFKLGVKPPPAAPHEAADDDATDDDDAGAPLSARAPAVAPRRQRTTQHKRVSYREFEEDDSFGEDEEDVDVDEVTEEEGGDEFDDAPEDEFDEFDGAEDDDAEVMPVPPSIPCQIVHFDLVTCIVRVHPARRRRGRGVNPSRPAAAADDVLGSAPAKSAAVLTEEMRRKRLELAQKRKLLSDKQQEDAKTSILHKLLRGEQKERTFDKPVKRRRAVDPLAMTLTSRYIPAAEAAGHAAVAGIGAFVQEIGVMPVGGVVDSRLTLPDGHTFVAQAFRPPPAPVVCAAPGCVNPKRFTDARSGLVACSLACCLRLPARPLPRQPAAAVVPAPPPSAPASFATPWVRV